MFSITLYCTDAYLLKKEEGKRILIRIVVVNAVRKVTDTENVKDGKCQQQKERRQVLMATVVATD